MLHEDDFLFAPVRRLVQAVSERDSSQDLVDIDVAVRDAVGLDLATVDALTPSALLAVLGGTEDRAQARRRALADVLDALAAPGPAGDDRRGKAATLRAG